MTSAIELAAQVSTYYAPSVWGAADEEALREQVAADPRAFFDRLLDAVHDGGVAHVELCYDPGTWTNALAAYGSAEGFTAALRARGLTVTGSYQPGWVLEDAIADGDVRRRVLEETRRHAAFLSAVGADTLLTGPPRRGVMEDSIAAELSEATVERIGAVMSDLGRVAAEEGVRLAIHTEAYSCFARPRDIRRVLDASDEQAVGLCADTGHIALDGGDPIEVVRDNSSRLVSMHWKDCIGTRTDVPVTGTMTHEQMMEQFRKMGDGTIDWGGLIRALEAVRFRGVAAAEIDNAPDPVDAVRDIVQYYEREMAPVYR